MVTESGADERRRRSRRKREARRRLERRSRIRRGAQALVACVAVIFLVYIAGPSSVGKPEESLSFWPPRSDFVQHPHLWEQTIRESLGRQFDGIYDDPLLYHLSALVRAKVLLALEVETKIPDGALENVSRILRFASHGIETDRPVKVLTLRIRGFRGIAEADLVFDEHFVLVGPNGVGKTTVIDALSP